MLWVSVEHLASGSHTHAHVAHLKINSPLQRLISPHKPSLNTGSRGYCHVFLLAASPYKRRLNAPQKKQTLFYGISVVKNECKVQNLVSKDDKKKRYCCPLQQKSCESHVRARTAGTYAGQKELDLSVQSNHFWRFCTVKRVHGVLKSTNEINYSVLTC